MAGTQHSPQDRSRAASQQVSQRQDGPVRVQPVRSAAVAATRPGRGDLLRIEAAASPWWATLPQVAFRCAEIAFLPIRWLVMAAEAAVSLAFVSLGIGIWLWWTGRIPDSVIAEFLGQVGKRLLAIVGKAGIL